MQLSGLASRLRSFRQGAFQCLVIVVLAAIGLWGHKTHWQFAPAQVEAAAAPWPTAAPQPGIEKKTPPLRIAFADSGAATNIGVVCAVGQLKSLVRAVTASGVVSYD